MSDHDQPLRYVEALALGDYADCVFVEECRRLGLPIDFEASPLDTLTMPATGGSHASH